MPTKYFISFASLLLKLDACYKKRSVCSNFDCVKNKQKSKVRLFCRAKLVGGLVIGVHFGTIDIDCWCIICCNNSENRQVLSNFFVSFSFLAAIRSFKSRLFPFICSHS